MRRYFPALVALTLAACADDAVAPDRVPSLTAKPGVMGQITGGTWTSSSTGVDMMVIGQFNNLPTGLTFITNNELAIGWGYANTPEGLKERALSWKDGVFTDLGTLGGDFARARQANGAGTIVGQSRDADGVYRPVVWENNVIRELPPLSLNFRFGGGEALAINERGDVVGRDTDDSGISRPALWPASGGVVGLDKVAGTLFALAAGISSDGTVYGVNTLYPSFESRAVIWTAGSTTPTEIPMPTGGRPGGGNIRSGQVFNDAGMFFGEIAPDPFNFGSGIVYRNGVFEALGQLPNAFSTWQVPYGLNERGEIVGISMASGGFQPVLWLRDNSVIALGVPPGAYTGGGSAQAINNRGLIVGSALREWHDGRAEPGAVLWRCKPKLDDGNLSSATCKTEKK